MFFKTAKAISKGLLRPASVTVLQLSPDQVAQRLADRASCQDGESGDAGHLSLAQPFMQQNAVPVKAGAGDVG